MFLVSRTPDDGQSPETQQFRSKDVVAEITRMFPFILIRDNLNFEFRVLSGHRSTGIANHVRDCRICFHGCRQALLDCVRVACRTVI
jgi:hypothetical protein